MRRWFRLSIDPIEQGKRASIVEASFFSVWAGAVTGNYLVGAALFLGAHGLPLGILGGLPALGTMLQIVSAPLVLGRPGQRTIIAVLSGLQRFSAALAVPIALWLLPSPAALVVFVAMHAFAWACMAPATVLWQGYMTDLIPAGIRGEYFSRRHVWSQVAGLSAVLLYGAVLDRLPGAAGFLTLSACALAAAALDFGAWFLHPDLPAGDVRTGRGFWETLRIPLSRPGPHRTASFFLAAWAFAQGLAVPFFPIALVRWLGLSFGTVSLLVTVAAGASVLSARFWGRRLDQAGHGRVLGLVTAMQAAVPVLLLAGRLGGWPVLVAAYLLSGSAAVGFGLANQTLNMGLAPREDRSAYFAFFAAMGGLTGFLTPVLVGPLTDRYLGPLFGAATVLSSALCLLWWVRVRHLVVGAVAGPDRP